MQIILQSGEVGVSFRNIIPGADRGEKQLLNQLERTLSEVSAACQQNQLLLDEFAQSAIPDSDICSMTASSTFQESGSSRVIGKQMKSLTNTDEEQGMPSRQNARLRIPGARNVVIKDGQSSEMIEMMPRLHSSKRFDQSKDMGVSSSKKSTHTDKTGTHPTVSKILSDMVKENEKRRQAASYRLYYKKPPKLRESLLSTVERKGVTTSEVAIMSREYTQSEPCLQQNIDHSNLAAATLKRRSEWTGNPQVFDAHLKATRRSSITFSPLVSSTLSSAIKVDTFILELSHPIKQKQKTINVQKC